MTTSTQQLIGKYIELEDRAEDAASKQLWDLAWWLAENVPDQGRGGDRTKTSGDVLTIKEVAAQGRRGAQWLNRLRRVGLAFDDGIVSGKSVREHSAALEAAGGDVDQARAALAESSAAEAKAAPDARDPRNTQTETHAAVLMLRASLKTLPDDDEQIAQLEKSLASARRVIDQAEKKLALLKAKKPDAGRAVA